MPFKIIDDITTAENKKKRRLTPPKAQ